MWSDPSSNCFARVRKKSYNVPWEEVTKNWMLRWYYIWLPKKNRSVVDKTQSPTATLSSTYLSSCQASWLKMTFNRAELHHLRQVFDSRQTLKSRRMDHVLSAAIESNVLRCLKSLQPWSFNHNGWTDSEETPRCGMMAWLSPGCATVAVVRIHVDGIAWVLRSVSLGCLLLFRSFRR